jgi:hypothetical protein
MTTIFNSLQANANVRGNGIQERLSANVASTVNIPNIGQDFSVATVDGIALTVGMRLLIKNQTNLVQIQTIVTTLETGTGMAGTYFTISSVGGAIGLPPVNYYVWYLAGGIGSDPGLSVTALTGFTGLQATIISGATAIQVATATVTALNTVPTYFNASNVGGTSATVTITNSNPGYAIPAAQGTTTPIFTFNVTQIGSGTIDDGIYTVGTGAGQTLRSVDLIAGDSAEFMYCDVERGTVNALSTWIQTIFPCIVDTTPQIWVEKALFNYTTNQMFYASSATNLTTFSSVNGGALVTTSAGVPVWSPATIAGYVLTSNGAGAQPTWQNVDSNARNVITLETNPVSANSTSDTAIAYFNWNYAELGSSNAQLFYEVSGITGGKTVTLSVYNESLSSPAALYVDAIRTLSGFYNSLNFANALANATIIATSAGSIIGAVVNSTGSQTLPVATFNTATSPATAGFPTSGQFTVTSTGGSQTLTYTGLGATSFTGVTGGTGTVSTATPCTSSSISVAAIPTVGVTVNSTGSQVLPVATFNTATSPITAGFPTSGQFNVTSGAGVQILTYTGLTASSFTGVTGGTGTVVTATACTSLSDIFATASIAVPKSLSIPITTSPFTQVVSYTGISTIATFPTFTGISTVGPTNSSIIAAIASVVGQNTRISVRVARSAGGGSNPSIFGVSLILNAII